MDITSITTGHVVVYPAATTDWFSRPVLAWRLSITLEAEVWPVMVAAARGSLGRYLDIYHSRRPHSSVGRGRRSKPISTLCRSASQQGDTTGA